MILVYTPWFACILSTLATLWLTPIVKSVGLKTGYFDCPDERKVHQQPMVRLGGIAICLATLSASLILWFFGDLVGLFDTLPSEKIWEFWGIMLGGFLFFLIGLGDDLFGLSPFLRLALQGLVASLVWNMGIRIEFLTVPGLGLTDLYWLSLPVTILWLVGVVNAINWMDGLDGLAAGITGIAASVMLVICLFMNQPVAAVLAAALAGSTLGFLRYNFNPAKIFMGDGGSYFIGFMIAGIGVIGLVKTTALTVVLLPFLILAVPIIDMSAVILTRLSDGKSPFHPDRRHLHHRLLKAGLSHRSTVLSIYGLTTWLGSLSLIVAGIPGAIFYLIGASLLLIIIGRNFWRKTQSLEQMD